MLLCHVAWGRTFSIGMPMYELHRFEDTGSTAGGWVFYFTKEWTSKSYFLSVHELIF
jgi:hypothetical protein